MATLFFNDREGAVPAYINDGTNAVPVTLGELKETDLNKNQEVQDIPTKDKDKKSKATRVKQQESGVTQDVVNIITGMTPSDQSLAPAPGPAKITAQIGK
jgi:hypothetical protein